MKADHAVWYGMSMETENTQGSPVTTCAELRSKSGGVQHEYWVASMSVALGEFRAECMKKQFEGIWPRNATDDVWWQRFVEFCRANEL